MSEAEITICSVARAVRNRKEIFLLTFSIFVLVAFLSSILPQPIYTATVLVVPNSEGDSSGFGNLSTHFSEAGALFGVNLDGADATKREYLAMLRSRSFGVWFIEKMDLMPFLFPERWDWKQGRWKPLKDSFITNFSRRVGALIARISNDRGWRPPSASPSAQEAYERFDKRIRMIKEDKKNGTIAIEFRYSDPVKAAEWANAYVDFVNREIRAKKIAEYSRVLSYLSNMVERSSVQGVRNAIYRAMEAQIRNEILVRARDDFAFRIVDKASVPLEPTFPKRLNIFLFFLISGVVGSITTCVLLDKGRLGSDFC